MKTSVKTAIPVHVKLILLLLLITILGFTAKYYPYAGSFWINNYLAGLFYEIFWCIVIALFLHRVKTIRISMGVLIVTCALEFLQLWHPPFLTQFRSTFIGRTLIGTSFSWVDFPFYFLGCAIGWFLIEKIRKSN